MFEKAWTPCSAPYMRSVAPRSIPGSTQKRSPWRRVKRLLTAHTDTLFGPPPQGRTVRVMVTMPAEAGERLPSHTGSRRGWDGLFADQLRARRP